MPKARTNYADDYDFWISKGRGQGKFRSYNPWLTIRDVKSPVGCSRIWSQKFKQDLCREEEGRKQQNVPGTEAASPLS